MYMDTLNIQLDYLDVLDARNNTQIKQINNQISLFYCCFWILKNKKIIKKMSSNYPILKIKILFLE